MDQQHWISIYSIRYIFAYTPQELHEAAEPKRRGLRPHHHGAAAGEDGPGPDVQLHWAPPLPLH